MTSRSRTKQRRTLERLVLAAGLAAIASSALAQPRRPPAGPPPSAPLEESHDLKAHFGIDMAQRLARSGDPDDRVRAITRAASTGRKEEAVTFLVGLADAGSSTRNDGRALVELALALARLLPHEKASRALLSIVNMPLGRGVSVQAGPVEVDTENAGRIELARAIAAFALSTSGDAKSVEGLAIASRGGSPGQPAARLALLAHPPAATTSQGTSSTFFASYPELGDLRNLETLRNAARSSDPNTRSLALVAMARMGDARAIDLAKAAITESEAKLKAAGAEALVILEAPEAAKAVLELFEDDSQVKSAIRLSERVSSEAIVTQVAARAARHPEMPIRKAATLALARSRETLAVRSLLTLAQDRTVQIDAVFALGRSPSPVATTALEQLLTKPPGFAPGEPEAFVKRLAARAYLVRAIVRGERSARAEEAIGALGGAADLRDREVAALVRVALGLVDLSRALGDKEPRMRRAALMGAHALGAADQDLVLSLAGHDPDPRVRELAMATVARDPTQPLPITLAALEARAEAANPDSAISAMIFAARAGEGQAEKVWKLLASRTPLVREHVARGLGHAANPQATGRLCAAYRYESDADVRRAIVIALARRGEIGTAWVRETLENASTFDPDDATRIQATRAIARLPLVGPAPMREVAWYAASGAEGPAASTYAGALRTADGVATPVVFDGDGFVVLPGVPPGDVDLVLEPRLR